VLLYFSNRGYTYVISFQRETKAYHGLISLSLIPLFLLYQKSFIDRVLHIMMLLTRIYDYEEQRERANKALRLNGYGEL
jgi:hypothetical protein